MSPRIPEAVTGDGRYRGRREGGVDRWLGVPYAAAPALGERFGAPVAVPAFEGVREALAFGPAAWQPIGDPSSAAWLEEHRSEDCRSLNVWSPSAPMEAETASAAASSTPAAAPDVRSLRPVLVWIHGGGYLGGGSRQPDFDGARLALAEDLVVVTLNYRVGPFGWLDLRGVVPGAVSNPGLRDLLAALTWLQRNLAAFGGDPDRVTIAGQSAGGNAVTTLLATPRAAGLFRAAIAQSSPALLAHDAATAAAIAGRFRALFPELDDAAFAVADPELLVSRIGALLDELGDEQPGRLATGPVIDGELVPEHPLAVLRSGRGLPVPLLLGSNAEEATSFRGSRAIPVDATALARWLGPAAAALTAGLDGGLESIVASERLATEAWFEQPAREVALGHAAVAPVHLYEFRHAPGGIPELAATHGIEAGFLFGNTDRGLWPWIAPEGPTPADLATLERMRRAWGAFVRTGDPGPDWPPLDRHGTTAILQEELMIERPPRPERRAAWARIGGSVMPR